MRHKIILLILSVCLWVACNVFGGFLGVFIAYLIDDTSTITSFYTYFQAAMDGNISSPYLQVFLIITHFFSFIVPAVLIASIIWRNRLLKGLKLEVAPGIIQLVLGIVILVCVLPFSLYLNSLMHGIEWPSWIPQGDAQMGRIFKELFATKNVLNFILNLILIGFSAAIGEELLFRGIIQQKFTEFFKNGHTAVIVTALIFGISHFQVEGLIVRVILGALLGYLFYYSGSLWISIFIHFFFNSIQVVLVYSFPEDVVENISSNAIYSIDLIPALIMLIIGLATFYYFKKISNGQENT